MYGAGEAAWPLIRADLALTYAEIGVLISLPAILANLIEPALGILADTWRRRVLILGGGVLFGLSALLTALSQSFWPLLFTFILFNPASGAFVGLSQAALMDHDPARREHNMARWTFAGSVGVVAGPLALGGAVWIGLGWRGLYAVFAVLTAGLVALAWRLTFPNGHDARQNGDNGDTGENGEPVTSFRDGLRAAGRALRRRDVQRWLVLLEAGDLMLDVLYSYLALYFVDVVGVAPERAGFAVAVWTIVGLVGDFLLIPLLERVRGLSYLRLSATLVLVIYPAFLVIQPLGVKLILLGLLGLLNAGWYAILKAQLYAAMPGQSGTSLAVNNAAGFVASFIPLGLGALADAAGLRVAMWLLLVGPVILVAGLPRHAPATPQNDVTNGGHDAE